MKKKKLPEYTTISIRRSNSQKLWKIKFKEELRNIDDVISFLIKTYSKLYGGVKNE